MAPLWEKMETKPLDIDLSFKKNDVDELYIKIFLGHSLKDNLSFNTYNLAKIDNNLLSSVIQKVDFEELFENIDFFKKEKEKNKKIQDFGLFL